ncbi:NAD(P)-binding protein [Glonium stellatum]|uniref:NAD(P)-binding protein n=1 Tax=Glonium stellatum TaxID=574774 RepID=A0A8E2F5T5_9PEZI|nr:NAD(P)-binding protein [Glonium stellatum]
MKDLKGKVALITGGATGIGFALALQLGFEGMKIVLASTNKERLEAAAEEVRKAGALEVLTIVCDVSDRASVESLHIETTQLFGVIDLLCCNVGVTTGGELVNHRKEDWEWVYGVVLQALGTTLRPEAAAHGVEITTLIVAGTVTDIIKSERSRPARFGDPLILDIKKREARRIPAREVAEKITRGIKENAQWVAAHPDLKYGTKEYFDGILAAYNR